MTPIVTQVDADHLGRGHRGHPGFASTASWAGLGAPGPPALGRRHPALGRRAADLEGSPTSEDVEASPRCRAWRRIASRGLPGLQANGSSPLSALDGARRDVRSGRPGLAGPRRRAAGSGSGSSASLVPRPLNRVRPAAHRSPRPCPPAESPPLCRSCRSTYRQMEYPTAGHLVITPSGDGDRRIRRGSSGTPTCVSSGSLTGSSGSSAAAWASRYHEPRCHARWFERRLGLRLPPDLIRRDPSPPPPVTGSGGSPSLGWRRGARHGGVRLRPRTPMSGAARPIRTRLVGVLGPRWGLTGSARVADVAAGTGKLARQLQAAGARSLAVEPSAAMRGRVPPRLARGGGGGRVGRGHSPGRRRGRPGHRGAGLPLVRTRRGPLTRMCPRPAPGRSRWP